MFVVGHVPRVKEVEVLRYLSEDGTPPVIGMRGGAVEVRASHVACVELCLHAHADGGGDAVRDVIRASREGAVESSVLRLVIGERYPGLLGDRRVLEIPIGIDFEAVRYNDVPNAATLLVLVLGLP